MIHSIKNRLRARRIVSLGWGRTWSAKELRMLSEPWRAKRKRDIFMAVYGGPPCDEVRGVNYFVQEPPR